MALHYSIITIKGSHYHCTTPTLHPSLGLFHEDLGATKLHLTITPVLYKTSSFYSFVTIFLLGVDLSRGPLVAGPDM